MYSTASGCTVSPLQVMLKGSNISHSWEDIDIEAISDVVLPRRGERPCNLVLANELEHPLALAGMDWQSLTSKR